MKSSVREALCAGIARGVCRAVRDVRESFLIESVSVCDVPACVCSSELLWGRHALPRWVLHGYMERDKGKHAFCVFASHARTYIGQLRRTLLCADQ